MGRFKFISLGLCLVLAVSLLVPTALAAEGPDLTKPASLTMTFQPDGIPAQGVGFRAYRVAELNPAGGFVPLEPFKSWPVKIAGLEPQDWPDLAATLEAYVSMKNVSPTASAATDSQGKAVFSALEPGFYLVTGEPVVRDGVMYVPQPVMICLPVSHQGTWIYDVTAKAKYDEIPEGSGDGFLELRVVKIWVDNPEDEEFRPESITIHLLKDGQVWDTVTLNQANNWRYTWTNLDENAQWKIVEEEVPEGYTVTITREGDAFLVTNTCEDIEIPPDRPPLDPDDEPPGGENPPSGENPPGGDKLPQTGMLWWPVPVLAVSGMGCYLVGWVKARKDESDEA